MPKRKKKDCELPGVRGKVKIYRTDYKKWIFVPFVLLCVLVIGIMGQRAGTKDKKEKTAVPSALQGYDAFLKEGALENKNKYYSLAALGDQKEIVLFVTEKVQEISNYNYGSCGRCQVYGMVDGKVALCGEVSAGGEDNWLLFLDNRLVISEASSITKITREKNSDQIVTEKRTLNRRDKENASAYIEWANELKYGDIEALIFYQNPHTKETKAAGPQKIPLQSGKDTYTKKAYSERENFVIDLTQDGVEDTLEIAWDHVKNPKDDETFTVSLKSGATGKVLWGLPVNTVHAGWYGVYHYEEKGKSYLMVFQPVLYQGIGNFSYQIFSVDETGTKQVLHSDRFRFDLNHPKETDSAAFENFVGKLNRYLRRAELLISTLEGNAVGSDDAPQELVYDPTEILQDMR